MDVERSSEFNGIAARQQLILDLMPKEMKEEVNLLWRRMDVVPAARRLSVMPGCKPIDRKFKMPSVRRTILPSPPKDPAREARITLLKQYSPLHRRPGFVNFEEYEWSIAMMRTSGSFSLHCPFAERIVIIQMRVIQPLRYYHTFVCLEFIDGNSGLYCQVFSQILFYWNNLFKKKCFNVKKQSV